jgi:hypothetical protein
MIGLTTNNTALRTVALALSVFGYMTAAAETIQFGVYTDAQCTKLMKQGHFASMRTDMECYVHTYIDPQGQSNTNAHDSFHCDTSSVSFTQYVGSSTCGSGRKTIEMRLTTSCQPVQTHMGLTYQRLENYVGCSTWNEGKGQQLAEQVATQQGGQTGQLMTGTTNGRIQGHMLQPQVDGATQHDMASGGQMQRPSSEQMMGGQAQQLGGMQHLIEQTKDSNSNPQPQGLTAHQTADITPSEMHPSGKMILDMEQMQPAEQTRPPVPPDQQGSRVSAGTPARLNVAAQTLFDLATQAPLRSISRSVASQNMAPRAPADTPVVSSASHGAMVSMGWLVLVASMALFNW